MSTVGVIGVGTMGAGIAQVAAIAGWNVHMCDVSPDAAQAAVAKVRDQLARLAQKGKLSAQNADAASQRLTPSDSPGALGDCDLIIEAVVEDMQVKSRLLREAASAAPNAILATNTSSLSVTKLGHAAGAPDRTIGMHFFNPVPLMPLVECVHGGPSTRPLIARAEEVAREWGKSPVVCRDTPGFIVNRVARGYYLEPLRMLGEGVATIDEIDSTLPRLSGFRMGPFALMDFIGIDVNYTVSCSVWEQLGRPARLAPHAIQKKLFEAGHFGRKTQQGFYSYASEPPVPAVHADRKSFQLPEDLYKAVRMFFDASVAQPGSATEQYILARTLSAIINEAALALDDQVASEEHIDTAMRLGTNYPHGPLEWARKIGRHTCRHLLDTLNRYTEDKRFAAANWLRE